MNTGALRRTHQPKTNRHGGLNASHCIAMNNTMPPTTMRLPLNGSNPVTQ